MNIEERTTKAEEFLNGLKVQVFLDKRFSRLYSDMGTLDNEIEDIIVDLKTKSKAYLMAKERARKYSINPFYQGQFEAATRDLEATILSYEKLCIGKIFPILKQRLIELPDKLNNGEIKLDMAAPIEQSAEEPPHVIKVRTEVVHLNHLGDKKINAFKEKINGALAWLEISLSIGKDIEKFLSEHGKSIIAAISGVLKMLA